MCVYSYYPKKNIAKMNFIMKYAPTELQQIDFVYSLSVADIWSITVLHHHDMDMRT